MKDKSLIPSNRPLEISDRFQLFIDSMMEEIVIEGRRPFDMQKKYLKKFSESEGIDYGLLKKNIEAFVKIIEDLRHHLMNIEFYWPRKKGGIVFYLRR